jgi:hypothetical protein
MFLPDNLKCQGHDNNDDNRKNYRDCFVESSLNRCTSYIQDELTEPFIFESLGYLHFKSLAKGMSYPFQG